MNVDQANNELMNIEKQLGRFATEIRKDNVYKDYSQELAHNLMNVIRQIGSYRSSANWYMLNNTVTSSRRPIESNKLITSGNSKWKGIKYLNEMWEYMSDPPESDEEINQVALDFLEDEYGDDFFDEPLESIVEDWKAQF